MREPMNVTLVKYEAARQALAAATAVDEVKDIRDKAVAMRTYAAQAKDTELIRYATDIRLRAERRAGEMLLEMPKAEGSRGQVNGSAFRSGGSRTTPPERKVATLEELGINKTQSSKWQKLARLTEADFEDKVEVAKKKAEYSTTSAPGYAKAEYTGEVEWYTPPEYLDLARQVLFGVIDLDPASSTQAQKTVKAEKYYTIEEDGLLQDWNGRIWLNPPYKQPAIFDFCKKMVDEVQNGNVTSAIMLTHNYSDTEWFHLAASACSAICFTRGRIKFVSADGEVAAPTQGQAFFYFGKNQKDFCRVFSEVGLVVLPWQK